MYQRSLHIPDCYHSAKDGSVKLPMYAKPMNDQNHKNKKNAFSQNPLSHAVSSHCNFNIVCGEKAGTYRFKTGFYGLTDMPKEFQKAMDNTLQGLSGIFCFLNDILIVSKSSVDEHNQLVEKLFVRLDEEIFAFKLSKWEFSIYQLSWLGFDIDSVGYRPKRSKIMRCWLLYHQRR